ncbi:zinc ribbon domain-containing protein [Cupriavidus sp. D384]|uniref:zinc ribbon domain-containing protein n=1 Tax=Cupriavidus sp. D384 TaxID=1538095 RepID=UPI000834DB4F|nr:zinc ribbon domain-containing protein [Cupriavidus sp. D384]
MALMKCTECTKEISDKATACPHCGARSKPKLKEVLAGVVVVVVVIGVLAQCVGSPEGKSDAKKAGPAVENSGVPKRDESAAVTTATIGRSTDEVLGNLTVIERSASVPLRDGSSRESIKLGKYLHLETVGDPADLVAYTMMFGAPSDDKPAAVQTTMYVGEVLANTFPHWGKAGNGDTVGKWMVTASKQLSANVRKNKDDPDPVILERDGLRIRYTANTFLGLFFITVESLAAS